jgi:hypothetical protein
MRSVISALFILGCHSAHDAAAIDIDGSIENDAALDASVNEPAIGSKQLCKLLSNRFAGDPTANDVQHRANVLGADLGIPVVHDDHLFILFGDTIGFAAIWGGGESHPDSVGFAADSAAAVISDPSMLCSDLGILHIGTSSDPSVQADFAGAAMAAPSGHTLDEYIHNPAGSQVTFPYLPGDFEVPSGAFAYGDSIYVFYTTVVSRDQPDMKASYLARWTNPSTTGTPGYQILYQVDERFDGSGALGGNFVNIAAEVSGDYVYLFGTGAYRQSAISVARKRLDSLATPGGFEPLGTIISTPGYGETSVHYFESMQRWVLLAEELQPSSNRIVAYISEDPAGPWQGPAIVHDMGDPAFRGAYCCAVDDQCNGEQMFNCDRTGFYGTYMLPSVAVTATTFTITYTMSSFSPYNVALFQATLPR